MTLQSLPLLPKLMILKEGPFIALYSVPQAPELFYLCKVISCETTTESISDAYDHSILKGMKYVKVDYLEKVKEKKGLVYYKLLISKKIFVLPEQIFYPDVPVSAEFTLNTKYYQFLSDCIYYIWYFCKSCIVNRFHE